MAVGNAPTYNFMNGWDLIAGTKQKKVNEQLQRLPQMHVSTDVMIKFLGMDLKVNCDVLFRPPSINVKAISGRQVDVIFPISGKITFPQQVVELPADPKPQLLTATVQLTQIEAELQDKKGKNKTKFDLIIDLKSKDLIVDFNYEGVNASELAALILTLKKTLQNEIADGRKFIIASFYLNNDVVDKYKAFIPHLADFTFIKDDTDPGNSNVLVLMLTKHQKRGDIFFNHPILPENDDYLLMVNNHLFLQEIICPKLVENIKKEAKNKSQVANLIEITANDATRELWTIQNTNNIDLDKDHDPWISKVECKVDETVDQLMLYLDVKADATFLSIHIDTWVRTWLKMQNDKGKISIVKAKEDSGNSTSLEWWKWLVAFLISWIAGIIVAIIYAIVDDNVPSLGGTFDSVATTTVEWPFQKQIAIKEALLPGHIVFTLDVKL